MFIISTRLFTIHNYVKLQPTGGRDRWEKGGLENWWEDWMIGGRAEGSVTKTGGQVGGLEDGGRTGGQAGGLENRQEDWMIGGRAGGQEDRC